MRHVLGLAIGLGVLLAGVATAWAQGGEAGAPPPPIDETTPSLVFPLFFPGGGIKSGTLGLCEGPLNRDGTCTTLSDTVTFGPVAGGNASELLLSDIERANDVPPDTGIPPGIRIDKVLPETAGPNGAETINYIPGPNDPGAQFDAQGAFIGDNNVAYSITSDPTGSDIPSVPEPSTIALVAAGMGPWVFGYLRRTSKA